MNTLDSIALRRSIRKFKPDPIPEETLQAIIQAGIQAPSGKNRQPWRFVIVKEDQRAEIVRVLREGIAKEKTEGRNPGSSEHSAKIMEQAMARDYDFGHTSGST